LKNKKKICVVINNRANYARIKSFLFLATKSKKIKLDIILGASSILERFGNVSKILKKDKLKVSSRLFSVVEGDTPLCMSKTTGNLISDISTEFEKLKPDAVIIIADRYENLAVAIAASYMNIPIIHLQGGEVSGSIDENVRHAITKLAHYHFTCTDRASKYVSLMGEDKKKIFNIGCPSLDEIKDNLISPTKDLIKNINDNGSGDVIDFSENFAVVVYHPVTTEYEKTLNNFKIFLDSIIEINKRLQIIWFWPNIDAGNDLISKRLRMNFADKKFKKIRLIKNLENKYYIQLLNNAKCIMGNSSSGIREASFMGLPTINIGNRQANRERGPNVADVDHDKKLILKTFEKQINFKKLKKSFLYGKGDSGKKMLEIILKIKKFEIIKKLNY
tara:strand:+ start:3545 stop:4714 length:1170 start_codon:yes stop_codon:yes gene_type:complete